ncbi:MAG: hypothetical protein U9N47_14165 [Thermodesulfobacteriota bacterium]|nr:hypothetical protein [Thermodesulfobacteriota bacterium]
MKPFCLRRQMAFFVLKGGEQKMAYTPELSMKSSSTLRRISWALGIPMTKGIEFIFEYIPNILDKEKVCQGCMDKTKCPECAFNSHNQIQQEKEGPS